MKRITWITFVLAIMVSAVSCGVEINPSVTLEITPESLDFGFIQVYSKTTQGISFENTGGLNITLTSITLDLDSATTSNAEIKITSGVLTNDVLLKQDESHKVDIEFRPRSQGPKSANLMVKYKFGSSLFLKKIEIKGVGYTGFINIQPAITDFNGLPIGSAVTRTVTITNSDSRTLTINSVYIAELSTNTRVNEFSVSNGWKNTSIALESSESHNFTIKFAPFTAGSKSAKLFVKIAESTVDFSSVLQGICYETLEITTSSPLPDADHGKIYSCPITCVGGDGKYRISVVNSTLPQGLFIDSLKITGTPEEHGDFSFTIQAFDDFGQSTQKQFNLHINYASLLRDPGDVDPLYYFSKTNKTGTYTVNLVAEGDLALTVTGVTISGDGYSSGEASISSQPTLPLTRQPGEKTQIVIDVVSLIDRGKSLSLRVEHTGYNSPFVQQFQWKVLDDTKKHVFILERSGSMSSSYSGLTIYDKNGNVIPYPTRWQAVCSIVKDKLNSLPINDKFDIISFGGPTTVCCFSTLKDATTTNINNAINWLYGYNPSGGDNAYNAFNNAFTIYGPLTNLWLYSDGFTFNGYNNSQIVQKMSDWINARLAIDNNFLFGVIQIGGAPLSLLVQIGSLPNCNYQLM